MQTVPQRRLAVAPRAHTLLWLQEELGARKGLTAEGLVQGTASTAVTVVEEAA